MIRVGMILSDIVSDFTITNYDSVNFTAERRGGQIIVDMICKFETCTKNGVWKLIHNPPKQKCKVCSKWQ